MQPFTIFPAIDLRRGRVVRLQQGRDDAQTSYGDDPVAVAEQFEQAGAQYLHVVDLDAAFGDGDNREAIARIVAAVRMPVQVGGGVRNDAAVDALLSQGVRRVIIGSAAVEQPAWVADVVARVGAASVVVGIDARDGEVKLRGWVQGGGRSVTDVARDMAAAGVRTVVYTDIARDGMLTGPDTAGSAALAAASGLQVVVSGGVGALEHLLAAAAAGPGIDGVIVGKALYEQRFTLQQALGVTRA
jgi:phosphoribosylformimino-5-aminoimidazole carboxamide ribotide isomerase